jgi:hypothetical protein
MDDPLTGFPSSTTESDSSSTSMSTSATFSAESANPSDTEVSSEVIQDGRASEMNSGGKGLLFAVLATACFCVMVVL